MIKLYSINFIGRPLTDSFFINHNNRVGKMQIVSRNTTNPSKNLKLSTKTAHTIKTSHTLKHKSHQNPQIQEIQIDTNSGHKSKGETPCKSQIQQKAKGYISITAKKRKMSVQRTKFADSHLSEHPYQQQNQEPVQTKFFKLQLNCNFLDLKSDRQDVALPKRSRKIEKIEQSKNEQRQNQFQTLSHHQFIVAHSIPIYQSIIISYDPLINQNDNFPDRTLTNIKTPINELKFQEHEDQNLINTEVFITGPPKMNVSTQKQTQHKINKHKVTCAGKKMGISKNLAALSTSFN